MKPEVIRYRSLYISTGYTSQNNFDFLASYLNNASGSDPNLFCTQNHLIF